jgi:hypothetical protein
MGASNKDKDMVLLFRYSWKKEVLGHTAAGKLLVLIRGIDLFATMVYSELRRGAYP